MVAGVALLATPVPSRWWQGRRWATRLVARGPPAARGVATGAAALGVEASLPVVPTRPCLRVAVVADAGHTARVATVGVVVGRQVCVAVAPAAMVRAVARRAAGGTALPEKVRPLQPGGVSELGAATVVRLMAAIRRLPGHLEVQGHATARTRIADPTGPTTEAVPRATVRPPPLAAEVVAVPLVPTHVRVAFPPRPAKEERVPAAEVEAVGASATQNRAVA